MLFFKVSDYVSMKTTCIIRPSSKEEGLHVNVIHSWCMIMMMNDEGFKVTMNSLVLYVKEFRGRKLNIWNLIVRTSVLFNIYIRMPGLLDQTSTYFGYKFNLSVPITIFLSSSLSSSVNFLVMSALHYSAAIHLMPG